MTASQTPIAPGWYREHVPPFDERYWDGGRWTGRRRFGSRGDAPPSRARAVLRTVCTLVLLIGPAVALMFLLYHIATDNDFWGSGDAPVYRGAGLVHPR